MIRSRCIRCHTADHPRLDLTQLDATTGAKGDPSRFPPAYEILLSPARDAGEGVEGRYLRPGSARESPLVWHLFGKRPDKGKKDSDMDSSVELMPLTGQLTDSERRLFVEWIDLGAQWSNRPPPDDVARDTLATGVAEKEK